jgi:hypothetical protein
MNRRRAAVTTALAAVLTLGPLGTLSACSDDSDTADSADSTAAPETVTETVTTEASETAGTSETSETSETQVPEGHITVSTSGSGPTAITTEDTPEGETYGTSGTLVVGPGSCFALKEFGNRGGDNTPRPLVLPVDSEFVTQGGRPSVTLPDKDTVYVGENMDVDVVSMKLSELDGLPDACARGASQTGLVVN